MSDFVRIHAAIICRLCLLIWKALHMSSSEFTEIVCYDIEICVYKKNQLISSSKAEQQKAYRLCCGLGQVSILCCVWPAALLDTATGTGVKLILLYYDPGKRSDVHFALEIMLECQSLRL